MSHFPELATCVQDYGSLLNCSLTNQDLLQLVVLLVLYGGNQQDALMLRTTTSNLHLRVSLEHIVMELMVDLSQ